mmetsp:Transcript_4792/g.6044  ORF Transcript_4792/g.6044 Transcript_4792/m.6044 type:complete len:273 (-) Transcript_4792:53-871(-)
MNTDNADNNYTANTTSYTSGIDHVTAKNDGMTNDMMACDKNLNAAANDYADAKINANDEDAVYKDNDMMSDVKTIHQHATNDNEDILENKHYEYMSYDDSVCSNKDYKSPEVGYNNNEQTASTVDNAKTHDANYADNDGVTMLANDNDILIAAVADNNGLTPDDVPINAVPKSDEMRRDIHAMNENLLTTPAATTTTNINDMVDANTLVISEDVMINGDAVPTKIATQYNVNDDYHDGGNVMAGNTSANDDVPHDEQDNFTNAADTAFTDRN